MTPHATRSAAPSPAAMDAIFRALADPTRRSVVERLSGGDASVSELASSYDMALPSFAAHLRVLEESGLVRSRKVGRVRTYRIEKQRLKLVETWLDRQRRLWEQKLDRLDNYLLSMKKENAK